MPKNEKEIIQDFKNECISDLSQLESIEESELIKAIADSEAQFQIDGKLNDARESLSALRKKHFSPPVEK
ncbi:hypothetical protein [Acidaminobacter sp.]|uniref:hypothetical protein n=1 Tax=Acidaminobacter sp. TaxID=1872102 RepID=UPI0025650241|nr:hypothetical protein [Acidaminobacter sp.]MDK9711150.1 hypothetical protein [Acidaminobacter sp.]